MNKNILIGFVICISLFLFRCGIGKESFIDNKDIKKNVSDTYDLYIIDYPFKRDLYKENNIKERKMAELSIEDLATNTIEICRVDSFAIDGKLLKTSFVKDEERDSIIYQYNETGQIIHVNIYYKKNHEIDTTLYFYDEKGMMTQMMYKKDSKIEHYNMYHNTYYKLTDKKISGESPVQNNRREIYNYNSLGQMIQSRVLVKNVPMSKELWYYDSKYRLYKKEIQHNGTTMHLQEFVYNDNGFLAVLKEKFRLSKDENQSKSFEFTYENY